MSKYECQELIVGIQSNSFHTEQYYTFIGLFNKTNNKKIYQKMTINTQSDAEYLDKMGNEYRYGCFSENKPDGK